MSNTSIQDPPAEEMSSSSGQMLPSRPVQSVSEPSASKRVCFYKSGDYQFSGHRMIVTARIFKTFDALLDALSKKVPLPFGVRTITTPRGTHFIKALEDLQDGGAYVCSDQKRVKPLNLEEVNRRQVPWNATRPLNARRHKRQELKYHQFGRGTDPSNRPAKVTEKVAVRTPKKFTVIKNRDPTVRRTIVLQRRTAPTFDALLDYLSQILQFPVLKLYSTDGRRVDGLAALILCSGIIVAAGNEPFRLGNQRFHRAGQTAQIMYVEHVEPSTLNPRMQKDKSLSSGRGSRNFSVSSERFIVNQINKSQKSSLNGYLHHPSGLSETEAHQHHAAMETCEPERIEDNEHVSYVVPHDDDIEKSFRINQDGSMTVEMKVRLTIKEEEMLHWTTTLSRSGLNKKTVCASLSGSDNSSPDSNNAVAKDSPGIEEDERKEENYHDGAARGVAFNEEHIYKGYSSTTLGRAKTRFKRTPTPGPQQVNERASVESVKMVTETGFQKSTLGHYSYMERTADGETTEGYCVVRHSSSSNKPKPCRTTSSEASSKRSSVKSSGVAEVLQIQNGGMEVTETVMHIYESQGCYDNYVANEELSADGTSLHGSPPVAESKPSTSSGPQSSSNDCDIDCNWQPPTTDSLERQKEEMLSLSSEAGSLTHQAANNLSSVTENEAAGLQKVETVNKHNAAKSTKKKKIARPLFNEKSSVSTNSSDKKHQESIKGSSKHSKYSSTDKLSSNASVGKKSLSSLERSKSSLTSKGTENSQSKKSIKDEKIKKDSALLLNPGQAKPSPQQKKSQNKIASNNGHNINTPTGRPQMKKNMSDILQAKKPLSPSQKTISRPKSMTECGLSLPKPPQELSESGSLPSLNPSSSEIHQYVENWLENANPDSVPYADEVITDGAETQAKVVFKIGDDSESDEINQCQTSLNDAMKKSSSCLSVPLYHEGLASGAQQGEQRARGVCVSMPSVRCDPENNENKLRLHKSVEALGTNDSEMSSSHLLSPKAKLRPVLRQVCSSIQCIRRKSTSSTAPTLQNSSSLPNFSTQVASVFGSSCKAFISFLSVMTLRDNIKGSQLGEGSQSRTPSEAMLMMESLQKISAMEDEEEQRASLTDLQSRASSQLREYWKDFQILRERLESEPLSPRVSETEFALDVVSDGGDAFEDQQMVLDELMEELNMPQDLREEIVSTIQQTKSFYPAEESTFVETVRNQSDSEEDLERFVGDCEEETKDSPEPRSTTGDLTETNHENDDEVNPELATESLIMSERDKELKNEKQETETVNNLGNNENVNVDEEDDREELEREREIEMEVKTEMQGGSEEEKTSEGEFVQKIEEVEEAMTGDEEVTQKRLEEEEEAVEETENADTIEDTDEREGAGETEEEGNNQDAQTEENEEQDDDEVESIINEEEAEEEVMTEGQEDEEEEEEEQEEGEEKGEEQDGEESKGSLPGETDEEVEEEEETERKGDVIEMLEHENMDPDMMSKASTFTVEGKTDEEESEQIEEDVGEKEEDEKGQLTDEVTEEKGEEEMENEEEEKIEHQKDEETEKETNGEKCDEVEGEGNSLEDTETDLEKETPEDEEVMNESDNEQNQVAGKSVVEEERNVSEESESNQKLEQMEVVQKDEAREGAILDEVDSFPDDQDCETMPEEASCVQHSNSCEETIDTLSKYSSEGQCENKCTDTIHETDEGGEEDRRNSLTNPVEISQELLDFVNDALQSYTLIFTYDTQGNVRIVPDNARVVQTKQSLIPKPRKDSSYGLKCLPSPVTSDLSDYRPETSGSGGYKTQESVDIVSESGEEPLEKANSTGRRMLEKRHSRLSPSSCSLKSGNSPPSSDEVTKASREDLSYFSAASSLKAETEAETQNPQDAPLSFDKDSADGVLIDRGRWLLKENHLIRKSPPVSLAMYGNLDSTSTDTGQENTSVDSPTYTKTQHSPLAAISSSELEEMAKPLTPKCTYYNMPHGSDSDPFLEDVSIRSQKHDASSIKARGFRVSPIVDTSKTWANRNGSLSSFASVEFKIPDRKVHPEVDSSAAMQRRRTSTGEQGALQAQDSLDSLHLRCGQYCPIL
ncbi:LOW QUALITY PROTEIN: oxygen-regulated protein 1 [Xiphophorus hellerii]|uniref:LOW QUALITY PROTEIN: oxygen-regulated protein 1 n=1 Tax=Xiphophorus hellerii TaxID=8084 RepID=UPI0013B38760|nr:LOW QUALITY PROTEIN: oxygen-regulated protein 1-like [Xiphophorus hellerii]